MAEHLKNGVVKFFNPTKGYGFVALEEGGEDIFFNSRPGLTTPKKGDKILVYPVYGKTKTYNYILFRDLDPEAEIIYTSWDGIQDRDTPIKLSAVIPGGIYRFLEKNSSSPYDYMEEEFSHKRYIIIPDYISNSGTPLLSRYDGKVVGQNGDILFYPQHQLGESWKLLTFPTEKIIYKKHNFEYFVTNNGEKYSTKSWSENLTSFEKEFEEFKKEIDSEESKILNDFNTLVETFKVNCNPTEGVQLYATYVEDKEDDYYSYLLFSTKENPSISYDDCGSPTVEISPEEDFTEIRNKISNALSRAKRDLTYYNNSKLENFKILSFEFEGVNYIYPQDECKD